MIELIYKSEAIIRLSVFLGGFTLLSVWEWILPSRELSQSKVKRWLNNLGLVVSSTILVHILVPIAAVGVAHLAEQEQWGLINYTELPFWLKVIGCFILLDMSVYLQHVMFHVLPVMWRFHRVHHSDLDCDVTTGLRFHPVEILISILIKMLVIMLLGAPVLSVILFEVVLNLMSMFTHSNIRLNSQFERMLRWVFVTPCMHRVHHSIRENETNSNFAFNLSLWDRIFGTYIAEPQAGQQGMTIGLDQFREPSWQAFSGLLYMPFSLKVRGYAINYRDTRNADELDLARTIAEQNKEKARLAEQLTMANEQLEELVRLDSLTNTGNRRLFDEVLAKELKRHNRTQSCLTLLLCDIDYFKNYNDAYGHQVGDDCLRQVAKALQSCFSRAGDVVARYGGEEFAVILPDTGKAVAKSLAQRMLDELAALGLKHEYSKVSDKLTLSIGVASLVPDQDTTAGMLVEMADKALYQAKESGRNNVKSSSEC